jgi:hypothetical protein
MTTYNTKLGEFCATHSNWESILSEEPYSLLIKRDDGFIIFNYRQLSSDFNNEIVREARGIIFREGEWECPVCHAFDKFGNYGEAYVPEMDWSTVKCTEKIDGSIMNLWCYDGTWHVSTNGNIDAKDAYVPDVRANDFDELFWEGIVKNLMSFNCPLHEWLNRLDKDYTYIFEMVSPYTRVVIPYEETDVYFLGARDNISGRQFGCGIDTAAKLDVSMFPRPKIYPMCTLTQIMASANTLPWDEEGYVCYDKDFNRCKIKSPKYVMAHFARNNNVITRWHLVNIILKGEMDEFVIYASDYAPQIHWVKDLMDSFVSVVDGAGVLARGLRKVEKPKAAELIKNFDRIAQPLMFLNYDRNVSGEEYVAGWDVYKWDRVLDQYIEFKERCK